MEAVDVATLSVGVAILAFLWNLNRDMASLHRDMASIHKDMAGLRERMARIEGLFEGFTGRHGQEPTQ